MRVTPLYRLFSFLLVISFLTVPATPIALAEPTGKTVAVYLPAGFQTRAAAFQATTVLDYGSFVWAELPQKQLTTLAVQGVQYQVAATTIGVYNYKFDPINDGVPAIPAALQATLAGDQPSLHLVQFAGPSQDAWLASAEAAGLKVLQYYAHNAYLVWGTPAQVSQVAQTAPVRWSGVFQPAYKLNPGLQGHTGRIENVAITFYNGGLVKQTLAQIQALGGGYIQHYAAQPDAAFYTAIFALEAGQLAAVAALPNVWAIDFSSAKAGFDDENGNQIVAGNYSSSTSIPTGYYNWLAQKGVNGSGVRWADVDTGLDATHPDITGRAVAFISYAGAPAANTDPDGHGTHTAGTIFGDGRGGTGIVDTNGFYWGTGMAPSSTLVVQNALMGTSWPPTGGWNILSRDTVLNSAIGSNNSWFTGASGAQGYSAAAREHDLMVRDAVFTTTNTAEPIIMVFSAGNAGSGASTMTEPKEAKNLITVGNSMNYPRTGTDINGLASSSSRGPALDGRILPNIIAPGSQTVSFRSTAAGAASCTSSVPGAGATRYAFCTGTSMAAPFAAGSTVLITDWWRQEGRGTPSPAMAKALLINGAVDAVGGSGINGNIPNNNQGWGRVNLNNVIRTGVPSLYYDQSNLLSNTGQQFSLPPLLRSDPTKPVKISLVWSDAAAGTGANPALVNNLDLNVTVGASLYRGNVFNTGWSVTGGAADTLNNIENVYLQNPGSTINISVNATNIAGDGVPYNGDTTDQDFALVIYNVILAGDTGTLTGQVTNATTLAPVANATVQATLSPTQTFTALTNASGWYTMTVFGGSYTMTASAAFYQTATVPAVAVPINVTTTQNFALNGIAVLSASNHAYYQSAGNGNGYVDPGETYTVNVGLRNDGVVTATGVNGTLSLLTGNGSILNGSATYNDIAPGATATNTTPFQFQVSLAQVCGQPLTFGFTADYDTNAQATYGFDVPVGGTQLGVTQTFTSTNVPIAVPDNNPIGITSTLTIAAAGQVGDIDVRLNSVTHSYVGDFAMSLVSPQGTSITLMNRPGTGTFGSSGDNFLNTILDDSAAATIESIGTTGPFTGRWRPDQALTGVNTQPISGTWALRVTDNAGSDTGTLNAWSVDVRQLIYICEPFGGATYGVQLSPATAMQAANPGTVVTHSLTLTNTGSTTDSFNLSATGYTWPTNVPASVGPLAPGASTTVNVQVTIPLTAAGNAQNVATVTATSQGNNAQTANATLTTVANAVYGVSAQAVQNAQWNYVGRMVTYTVWVTNTGNTTDTYTVMLSGNLWNTSVPATVGPLAGGASTMVNVVVTIPLSATHGATDMAHVDFTSVGNAQTTQVMLTTTAAWYRNYLSHISK